MATSKLESLKTKIFEVKMGTGKEELGPPWSRGDVKWHGLGVAVLRLATENTSRWLLGGGFESGCVFPHEKTFTKAFMEKSRIFSKTKMNPWPSHLACLMDQELWRNKLASVTNNVKPSFDNGHITMWHIRLTSEIENLIESPCIILDGHHSRAAQRKHRMPFVFGWVEPFFSDLLEVQPILRVGILENWLEECLQKGLIDKLNEEPQSKSHQYCKVVQSDEKWFCKFKEIEKDFTAIDQLHFLAKDRSLRSRARFQMLTRKESAIAQLRLLEIDTMFEFNPIPKDLIWTRALEEKLFPQKSTYFLPKIPFGLLVQDLLY